MNRRVIFVSAFAAVLMMSMVAYGQRPGGRGPGGRGMASAMLLRQEAVQKELGVSAEQLTKLKDVLEAGRVGRRGRRNLQDMTDEERQKLRDEMVKRTAEQDKEDWRSPRCQTGGTTEANSPAGVRRHGIHE